MMPRRRSLTASVALVACCLFAGACGRKHKRVASIPAPAPRPAESSSAPSSSNRGAGYPAPTGKARSKPQPVPTGYSEEGIASWYGIPYHGRHAADGEIYDMETLVAAHRLMPFDTWLRVTNLGNNKTVTVRVIDRGPFVEGRIIDLSKAAARQIDLLGPGVGRVRLEVIAAPPTQTADNFYAVQVGAFSVYQNAERARIEYERQFGAAQLAVKQGRVTLWRVLVGREQSIEAAQRLASTLHPANGEVFVVKLDDTVPAPPVSPAQTPAAAPGIAPASVLSPPPVSPSGPVLPPGPMVPPGV